MACGEFSDPHQYHLARGTESGGRSGTARPRAGSQRAASVVSIGVMAESDLAKLLPTLFRSHPWHGVAIGGEAPAKLTAYIEIVPIDTVKYELDKATGILKVDRPQRFSNVYPCLYGLIPQTYCGERVAALFARRTGRERIAGDGDPLDICVLTERAFSHGDFLLQAIPIGGLSMLDGNEADDKIIAVMAEDALYGEWRAIADIPKPLMERLEHYFLTYKLPPGAVRPRIEIPAIYDRDEAHEVIRCSQADYEAKFGHVSELLAEALAARGHG